MTDPCFRIRSLHVLALMTMMVLGGSLQGCNDSAIDPDHDDEDRPASSAPAQPDFVRMAPDVVRAAGIEYGEAGPGTVFESVELQGTVTTDPQRVRHVQARYPGVVRDLRVRVGDKIAADAVVASVESDESLQTYMIRSPIGGVVTELIAAAGDHVADQPMMTIVDLSHVWVDIPLFASDTSAVRSGMAVEVRAMGLGPSVESTISFVSPIGKTGNNTTSARVVIPNFDGRWIPGMSVTVEVRQNSTQAPVIVPREAVQQYDGKSVVFVKAEGGFRRQPVVPGIDDGSNVEIRSGLRSGDTVAVTNSYVVLAELQKGSVSDED